MNFIQYTKSEIKKLPCQLNNVVLKIIFYFKI